MSPSLESAEAQWLAQLRTMREAIADLKLDQQNGDVQPYGHDIPLDDDEFTGGSGSDDIWDIISDEEGEVYSSDYIDGEEDLVTENGAGGAVYGQAWLTERCIAFARGRTGLNPDEVQEQIVSVLASDSNSTLYECLIEQVHILILLHRRRVTSVSGRYHRIR